MSQNSRCKFSFSQESHRAQQCPPLTKGKSFELWKSEVKAWKIVVEDESNKKKMAVELAINLPHNHPIKKRVFDSNEHGVDKLNTVTRVDALLKFLEEKVFYNDPTTDRYKVWQNLSKIARDKNKSMTAYI